eukprot:4320062-Pyramimonas_sp.AAC.1
MARERTWLVRNGPWKRQGRCFTGSVLLFFCRFRGRFFTGSVAVLLRVPALVPILEPFLLPFPVA